MFYYKYEYLSNSFLEILHLLVYTTQGYGEKCLWKIIPMTGSFLRVILHAYNVEPFYICSNSFI